MSSKENAFRVSYLSFKISVARADGSMQLFHIPNTDEPPSLLKEWREARIKDEEKFVGLAFTNDRYLVSNSIIDF